MKYFSVVLVTTSGRSQTLRKCLESIVANAYPSDLFEVIVIDSGIDRKGLRVMEEFSSEYPNLRFFSPGWGNVGPAKARNYGIEKARNEIVAFTDDDCVVPKDWLSKISSAFEKYPEAAGVGGYLEASEELLRTNIFARYEKFFEAGEYGVKDSEFVSTKRDEAPFETNNIAYRKEVLIKVGGFDERYSALNCGEDGDLKERVLRSGGFLVFVPVKVYHLQEYSFRRFFPQQIKRGGAILLYNNTEGRGLESRLLTFLKITVFPLSFFVFVWSDKLPLDIAALGSLGFLARQLGKLKHRRYVENIVR